jgi:nucleoside 2-deoxyribosyltransferase
MKPRVYLAGPIFQQPDPICADWRGYFTRFDQFEWVDPMMRDFRGKEDSAFAEIVEGDKTDIDRCQAVIAHTSITSAGTSMEILWAWMNHTPVISIVGERVSPWVRYHSTRLARSEEEALAALNEVFA